METYDPELAARVWQRVRGEGYSGPDCDSLPELIAGEWRDAAVYLHLSRRVKGQDSARLHRLFEEEQSHAACLRGIYKLMTRRREVAQTPPPAMEPVGMMLRKCYARELRSIAEYDSRAKDPEYGPVFRRMADQEREHCRVVLEILGNLQQT